MSDESRVLPELETALGNDDWRAAGIETWEDVALLGRSNLRLLSTWAELAANQAMLQQDRSFLMEARPVMKRLASLEAQTSDDKPLLPRLRRENFRLNEPVALYVGELPDTTPHWAHGSISAIEKAFNVAWKGPETGSGYYWRITAQLTAGAPTHFSHLSFSTSEPRAMPESELQYLKRALSLDRRFAEIYAVNARREWQPLWCLEGGLPISAPGHMNMLEWLAQA